MLFIFNELFYIELTLNNDTDGYCWNWGNEDDSAYSGSQYMYS